MKKFIVPIVCMTLVGCTQAQILTDLDIAAAALAAVSTVPGIPPPFPTYLSDTATALDCVSSAVEKGGTNAQVALAISTCGLSAVAPNLPPGTPSTIAVAITAVIAAVQKVVSDIAPIANASAHIDVPFAQAFGPHGSDKFKMGVGGKEYIKKIRAKIAEAKANLAKVKK
jgi:hypothetical protein